MVRSAAGWTGVSIQRPVGTLAIVSVVVMVGLFFQRQLPVDLLPDLNYPEIIATVNLPGTPPEVMEEQVTRVLENSLSATEGLIRIKSRASEGRTNVNLFFDFDTNIDLALQDAARNLELARTQLPTGIEPPRLYKVDPNADPVFEVGFLPGQRSELEVRDWLENELAPQLLTQRGVGGIEVSGGRIREMQVTVHPERLVHHGLSATDVHTAIASANQDVAAGWVIGPDFAVMSSTDTRFRSAADLERVRIPIPGGHESLRVDEVATVRDTHREERLFVRLNGAPAVRLSVFKLPDANTLEVIDGLETTLHRLQRSGFIPPDLEPVVTRDQRFFLRSSIGAVAQAALYGGLLAIAVVLLFLGSLRRALIIGTAIPISLMATFAMMGFANLTLNIMTLGGLALGVGILLDNAIVMIENITRQQHTLNKDLEAAAHDGATEVRSALIAATATNLAAVLPFLLITGLAAMLFRELILTMAFAILASLAVSLTVVPSLCVLLGRVRFRSPFENALPFRAFRALIAWLSTGYGRLARPLLRWRWLVLLLAVGSVWAGLRALESLNQAFLPAVDDGQVSAALILPPGVPPETTLARAMAMEDVLTRRPEVQHAFGLVGGHLGGGTLNERPGTARYSVSLGPSSERPNLTAGQWVEETQEGLRDLGIPGARINVRPPRLPGLRLGPGDSAIAIGIMGPDLSELDRIGRTLLQSLEDIPGLVDLDIRRDSRSPLLRIQVDHDRAHALNLDPRVIAESARAAVNGTVPTTVRAGQAQFDVRVVLPADQRQNADDLANIPVQNRAGQMVLLGDVASLTLDDGPAHIERENQLRILRLSGEINPETTDLGSVTAAIHERTAELDLPDGYRLIFGGEEALVRETRQSLQWVILLALFLVLAAMAVQYEQVSSPLVITAAAPLALVGVVALLHATETPLSAPVLLGAILLIGIVVNHAILLVDVIERKVADGAPPLDAAVEAGVLRLRPILMTTITTVCGMLPLALGMGDGAELMRPLALAVVGGLCSSMVLSLVVVPAAWLTVHPLRTALRRGLSGLQTRDGLS